VDPVAVGATIAAFVEVSIEHPRYEPAFLERVRELDEVLECHHVTGEFSLLLKLRVADMAALQDLLLHGVGARRACGRRARSWSSRPPRKKTYVETFKVGARK